MKTDQVYIHYGSEHFDKELFVTPKNCWWKPMPDSLTGLWASRVDDPLGWKPWCEANEHPISSEYFKFRLSENTTLLVLSKPEDLEGLPHISPEEILHKEPSFKDSSLIADILSHMPPEWCFLDYEMIYHNGVDAIEITGWPSLSDPLSVWDCNCIYVMNPDIVIEVEAE